MLRDGHSPPPHPNPFPLSPDEVLCEHWLGVGNNESLLARVTLADNQFTE